MGVSDADFVLKDGGSLIYCSPSPGVHTEVGDFPGLALMDLMKPYMPPTAANYERILRDIHARVGRRQRRGAGGLGREGGELGAGNLPFAGLVGARVGQ